MNTLKFLLGMLRGRFPAKTPQQNECTLPCPCSLEELEASPPPPRIDAPAVREAQAAPASWKISLLSGLRGCVSSAFFVALAPACS